MSCGELGKGAKTVHTPEPIAYRLTNTSYRKPHFEYFTNKEEAERRQFEFNRSVDDGGLLNIKDRYAEKKRFGATGDELRALELLCDVSEDFWKKKSGGLFIDAEAALHRARQMHLAEASMKEAA